MAGIGQLIARARAESERVLWVDAGDALFGRTDLAEALIPQAERKAKALAEIFTKVGVDAFAPGERDLLRGPEFLRSLGMRSLLNAGYGPEEAPTWTLKDVAGIPVGLVAASPGERGLALAAQKAREAGARVVIALLHATMTEARQLVDHLPRGAVDAAIAGHSQGELGSESSWSKAGSVPVFQPTSRGRELLRLELSIEEGRTGFSFSVGPEKPHDPNAAPAIVRFIKVGPEVAGTGEVQAITASYVRDLEALNGGRVNDERPCSATRAAQLSYAGAESCKGCHAAEYAAWEKDPHARAFEAVRAKGRAFDLECARCHVTGLFAPGGVCRVDQPQGRDGVQCEACHGPGSAHLANSTRPLAKPSEAVCRGCHTGETSSRTGIDEAISSQHDSGHGSRQVHHKR